jgi:hypothetical protein
MRHFLSCMILAGIVAWAGHANAQDEKHQWTGMEVLTIAQTEVSMFRGSVHHFWIPKAEVSMAFVYAGPKLKLGDWGWISPQVGLVANWKESTDFLNTSVWAFGSVGDFSLFLEGDFITALGMDPDVYTLAVADYNFSDFNVGVHSEGINDAFGFGPHVGYTKAVGELGYHGEIQYFFKPPIPEGAVMYGHAVRVVTGLSF